MDSSDYRNQFLFEIYLVPSQIQWMQEINYPHAKKYIFGKRNDTFFRMERFWNIEDSKTEDILKWNIHVNTLSPSVPGQENEGYLVLFGFDLSIFCGKNRMK